MTKTEHMNNLKEIRSIMERSVKFISLSGLSGVATGLIALLAAGLVIKKLGHSILTPQAFSLIEQSREIKLYFLYIAVITLTLSLLFSFFFTSREAGKKGLKIWDNTSRRFLFNLFFPIAAGGIFILAMIHNGIYGFVCGTMLIFYGIALLNASKYAHDEIRYLGIFEVLLGILAAFFLEYGVLIWGAGFGALNAVYGIIMYLKYEN